MGSALENFVLPRKKQELIYSLGREAIGVTWYMEYCDEG